MVRTTLVDLDARLVALVSPLSTGDDLLPGVRFVGASSELGLRLTFETSEAEVHVEVKPESTHAPHAARTSKWLFGYRVEGDVPSALGLEVCRAVAKLAAPNEDAVLDAIASDARAARDGEHDRARIREVEVRGLLVRGGTLTERYDTLSPYVGCLIGCRFCYAQSKVDPLRRLSLLPDVPWGSYVDVRINAPEVLRRELAERPVRPIKFCPIVSDPYHAIEKRYALTRACLEVIRDAPSRPVLVLTRSALVERDLELIASMKESYVGVSLPTIDDEVRRHFEPRGATVAERLGVLRRFAAAGVRTLAMVQPILPGSIDALADALAEVAQSVRIDVLHGVEGAASEFADARYAQAADAGWQLERATMLRAALERRGVALWTSELPPSIAP